MGPAGLEPATYRLRVRSRVCACLRLIADWLSDAESPTCSELPFAARYRVVVVHLDGPGEKLGLTCPARSPMQAYGASSRVRRALAEIACPWPVLDGVSRAALDPGLVAFGSTLRLVADEDRLPERDLLASARLTPPT